MNDIVEKYFMETLLLTKGNKSRLVARMGTGVVLALLKFQNTIK